MMHELFRLAGAAQEWARATFPPPTEDAARSAGSGSVCDWCPICRVAATLRADRPEMTAVVADASTGLAAAARALLETLPVAPAAHRPEDAAPPLRRRVHHVELTDRAEAEQTR